MNNIANNIGKYIHNLQYVQYYKDYSKVDHINLSHMNLDHNKITNPRKHWTLMFIEES